MKTQVQVLHASTPTKHSSTPMNTKMNTNDHQSTPRARPAEKAVEPRVGVYLCGPPGLMDSVEAAAGAATSAVPAVALLLHRETFEL